MLTSYYTESYTRKRPSETKTGGVVKTTYVESAVKKGKIDPLRAAIVYQSGSQQIIISHKLFTAVSEDIKEKDIIIYGSKQYNVIEVLNPFSKGHHLECLLESRH